MRPKNVQHVPTIKRNLVSGTLLLRRDDSKVVLDSNKVVVSKHGHFIAKAMSTEPCSTFLFQNFAIS